MPSTNGHYDHTLLASAPAATKQQIQEGYTTEILAPMRKPDPSLGAISDPELAVPRSGSRPPTAADLNEVDYYPEKEKPFWRTTKGIAIIVLAIIAVLGAVIGGAVGGTVGRHRNPSNNQEILQSSAAASGTGQSTPAPSAIPKTDQSPEQPQATGSGSQSGSAPQPQPQPQQPQQGPDLTPGQNGQAGSSVTGAIGIIKSLPTAAI